MSREDNEGLELEFDNKEIRRVVRDNDGDKSIGSDGLNFHFIQKC